MLRKGSKLGVALMSNNPEFSPYGDDSRATNELLLSGAPHVNVPAAKNAQLLGPLLPETRAATPAQPSPAATPRAAIAEPLVAASARSPFTFSVAADRRRLRRALAGGLRARAKCSTPCTVRAILRDARGHAVAEGAVMKAAAGRRSFTIRFTSAAVRKLRGKRSVRLTLAGVARAGNEVRTVRRRMALR